MSDPQSRFAEFVKACTEVLELPDPTIDGDNYMFQVGDRWIELKRNERGDIVNFLSVVYLAPPEGGLRDDLISSFNTYYLFNGGFSLVADLENRRIYLGRAHRLDALDARDIRRELLAFAETASMAGTWYLRSEDESAPPPSAPPREDPGSFLKV